MTEPITVTPVTIFLEDLLKGIANGKYQIPVFQRDFIWTRPQMIDLFDSLLKGYPIGSLLLWNTKDNYQTQDKIGPYTVPKDNSDSRYVLDGFQRISTLFGVLMNPKDFQLEKADLRDFSIFFDIKDKNFTYKNLKNFFSIPLYAIYDDRELFDVIGKIHQENIPTTQKNQYIDNARNLYYILHKYRVPLTEIDGGDIKSAIEIFSRLNSKGKQISEDFMLSALSYNVDTGFLLSESITNFLNKLKIYNFNKLKRGTILDCISNLTGKFFYDVKIEELKDYKGERDLNSLAEEAYMYINKTVEFLYKKLFLIDVRFLPYPAQLIFISEYFRLNPEPKFEQKNALKKWFWITTYSNYFTLYSMSQQRSAYQVFCKFAQGEHPDGIYRVTGDSKFNTALYPDKLNFMGVRSKALKLFYLKSIMGDNEPENKEKIEVNVIFPAVQKDRTPGNIILRLSSEFDEDKTKQEVQNFIENSPSEVLDRHFITQDMVNLYRQNKMEEFITERDRQIQTKEGQFVENLGIEYLI